MTDAPIDLSWEARTSRPNQFDPPPIFGELREERPLRPMRYADGHVGWLATGYHAVRAILADRRFSIRRDRAHPPHEVMAAAMTGDPPPPGLFAQLDPPKHTRYRKLLVGEFTVRRMRALEAKIAETTGAHLDAMVEAGPPADILEALALPVPANLICQLLGLPADRRATFQAAVETSISRNASPEDRQRAAAEIMAFFAPLIADKRETPTDDFYSGLINSGELTDEELTMIGMLLFAGGFETTSNALTMSTLVLLQNPDQLDALRREPSLIDNTVEELLRFPTGPAGMLRTAMEDVEIEGELIREGQTVELLIGAANRDPSRFDHPDTFDISRSARGQLTFGHGIHQCIGQQLARVELRTVIPALFDRLPRLRLATPPEEIELKESAIGGIQRLLVTW